jgi:hypothetical protein
MPSAFSASESAAIDSDFKHLSNEEGFFQREKMKVCYMTV